MGISFLETYVSMIFGAMRISVLEEILFLGWFLELILLRLEGHGGERFGGIVWDGFWRCRGPGWGGSISGCKTNHMAEQNLTYSFNLT